jgi:hypothetical protein
VGIRDLSPAFIVLLLPSDYRDVYMKVIVS